MLKSIKISLIAGLLSLLLPILLLSTAYAQEKLNWQPFERAFFIADSADKPIFVDIWAPWCGWCRKMKREVYPKLQPLLSEAFVLTRLNRDDNQTKYQYKGQKLTPLKLAQQLNAQSVPTVILLSASGEYLLHISGFVESESLKSVLSYIASGAYKKHSLTSFEHEKSIK